MGKIKKKYLILLLPLMIIGIVLFAPVMISINGSKEITIEVYDSYQDPGATLRINGELKTEGEVDCNQVGTYQITYSWLFEKTTRKVHVVDTTAPALSLQGDQEIDMIINTKYVEDGYEVSDNYDEDIEVKVSSLDTTTLGDTEITYTASDQSGNTTTLKRIVHIIEDDYHYLRNLENPLFLTDAMIQPIIDFYDEYFRSMRYLTSYATPELYSDPLAYRISDTAFNLMIDTRKASINDLYLNDCKYDLIIKKIAEQNNITSIDVIVNEDMNFNFMYETTSSIYGIEDQFDLVLKDGVYKIQQINKGEGFYSIFSEHEDDLENTYSKMINTITENYQLELTKRNEQLELPEVNKAYDRIEAVKYAHQYWHERNEEYSKYESNCMNFGSQVIYAGGMEMDYTGSYENYEQWKNFGSNYNENETANGLVYTWTYIPFFREYLQKNSDGNLIGIINAPLFSAEGGDMIQISNQSLNLPVHNMVVVDRITDDKGEVIEIIVNGNTLDMHNWPLSASAYPYKSLVKIIGSNK